MHLHDMSYYYSNRPSFLSSSYTFPSIGPEPPGTSQNIPAKDRYFNASIKTYGPNPTTIAPPQITGFTQDPEPIVAGNIGYVYCNATGSNLQYNWQVLVNDCSANVTFNGNQAKVSVPWFPESLSDLNPEAPENELKLSCTVTNPHGSDNSSY